MNRQNERAYAASRQETDEQGDINQKTKLLLQRDVIKIFILKTRDNIKEDFIAFRV